MQFDGSSSRSLDGVKVVSIEQAVAAPYCTRLLADLGASVVKIEKPGSGDFARHYDRSVRGQSAYFVALNGGKKSLTLNIQNERAHLILRRLIEKSDVFVHNLRPTSINKLILDFESVRSINPNIVYCGISGYGKYGPLSQEKAYDLIMQGESGLISLTGYPEKPAKVGISLCDLSAGMFSALAIVAAIHKRQDKRNFAQEIDTSLFNCILDWVAPQAYYSIYSAKELARTGMRHNTIAPYGAYVCADGRYIICAVQQQEEWRSFCEKVMERPDLIDNELYHSNEARIRNRDTLESMVEATFRTRPFSYWWKLLGEADIGRGNVNSTKDLFAHPQISNREGKERLLQEVLSPDGQIITAFRSPLINSIERNEDRESLKKIPGLGEHNFELLSELGLTQSEIKEMQKDGAI